jgi:hypothetical protein
MHTDIHLMDSMPGKPPAWTAIPAPIFDQLKISIWKGLHQADIILPTFEEYFGKPEKTWDGKAWRWKDLGISISAWEIYAYRVIRCPAVEKTLAAISPILKLFPNKPNGKAAAQLLSAEIAWDFPVSLNYDEAEAQQIQIACLAIPANKLATMKTMEPSEYAEKKFKHCADGATNGLISFYFKSFSRQPDKTDDNVLTWQPRKKAVSRGIIYCKRLAPKEPWSIRFESTLLGPKLEKVIGKALPYDLTHLPRRLAGLCFDDFWYLERFNWSEFIEAARRSADYKGIPFADVEAKAKFLSQAATRWNDVDVTLWQKRIAKKIAKLIRSKPLENKIGTSKFSTPISLMEVLQKNFSGK